MCLTTQNVPSVLYVPMSYRPTEQLPSHRQMRRFSIESPNRLRRALDGAGMSASELARRLDVSKATVSRWEHGDAPISTDRAEQIGAVLGVDPGFIVGWTPSQREWDELGAK